MKSHNIVIAISAFEGMNEFGGHYFSALITAKELSKSNKVTFVVIGDFIPRTLKTKELNVLHFKYNPARFSLNQNGLTTEIKRLGANIIIAFDENSGSILRWLSAKCKIGFIQVKAGGPIPRTPLQNNPYQVHFSKSDYKLACKRINYRNRVLSWIPNRVQNHSDDARSVEFLKNNLKIRSDELVIIRISRIDKKYENAFLAAINASKILREGGYKVRLIMIGSVSDKSVEDRLNLIKNPNDHLLTSAEYTTSANRYLGIAHMNLGVGRGFMEGCAAGNYMLAMAGSSHLPVVVNEENFHELFDNNFSLRSPSSIPDNHRTTDILKLARKIADGNKISNESKLWFKKYFDCSKLNELYQPILDAASSNKEKFDFKLLMNASIFLFKYFIGKV